MKGAFNFESGADQQGNTLRKAYAMQVLPPETVSYASRCAFEDLLSRGLNEVAVASEIAIDRNTADPIDGKDRALALQRSLEMRSPLLAPPGYEDMYFAAQDRIATAVDTGTLGDKSRALRNLERAEKTIRAVFADRYSTQENK